MFQSAKSQSLMVNSVVSSFSEIEAKDLTSHSLHCSLVLDVAESALGARWPESLNKSLIEEQVRWILNPVSVRSEVDNDGVMI